MEGAQLALDSTGGASERMAIYTESLEGKLKTLQATWEEFVLNLQASDAFKSLIDLGTKLISVLDLLLNKIPILSNIIKIGLVAGALNVAAGTIRQLITLIGTRGLVGTLINVGNGINILVQGINAGIGAFSISTDVISALSTSFGTMASAAGISATAITGVVSALAPLAIVAAAIAGIALADWFYNGGAAAKKAEKAMSDFNKKQQELSEVQSELDQVDDKIAEINAKDGLTLTDQQELINLKKQRAELDALKKTYDSLSGEKTAAADAIGGAVNARYKTTRSFGSKKTNTGTAADLTGATAQQLHNVATIDASQHNLDQLIGGYKELKRVQEEVASDGKTLDNSRADSLDKISTALSNELTYLQQQKTDLESLGVTSGAVYDDIVGKISSIEQVVSPEAWQNKKFSDLIFGDESAFAEKANALKEQIDSILNDESLSPEQAQAKAQQFIDAFAQELANNQDIKAGLDNIFGAGNWDVDGLANSIAEEFGYSFSDALANTDIDLSKIDFSGLDESVDEAVNSANDKLASLGNVSLDPSNFDGVAQAITNAGDATDGLQGELDNLQGTYDALSTNAENAAKMFDFMTENMDILSGAVTPTAAQMDKLKASAAEIGPVIDTSTGQAYSAMDLLNQTVYNTGATAGEMQTNVQSFMGGVTNAGNNTITTMNAVIVAINKVKSALATALNAAAGFIDKVSNVAGSIANNGVLNAAVNAFGGNLDAIKNAANGLGSVADGLRAKATALTNSIKSDTADMIDKADEYQSKITNAGNAAKKAYDKSAKSAAKAGKSGSGSTKKQTDATKKLTEALKEEYEAQKAILDAQKKQLQARKEALAKEKSDLADAKEAIQDLVDMTMKMLKQEYQNRVDILEKQIDALEEDLSDQQDKLEKAYNKQTEALENQLDAFNEKIEAQKEYLKLQKEEQEHAEELSEKNQAIADVQAQLEELRYDNSAAAQKKRLELLDELNGAQKDLTDYQNQYDYDTKVDGLDKEQSAFQQQIENEKNALKDRYDQEKQQIEDTYNAKIDALNKEKDYIKNTLMEEYNLYQEAINLIQGKSQDFYNRLIEFNRVYGSHIDSDIVIMWGKAYDALSKYGYLGNTVQEILDGITYRTEEIVKENAAIEDSIKSIENQLDALKTKYDAATAAAKQLAAANDAATQSANNLAAARAAAANAGKATTVSKPAKGSSVSSGSTRVSGHQTMAVFHEGTNYVKKANTWLDDMLGLAPNETAAILKEGEAVIPDYNNPANPASNFSYGKMAESMSKSITYSNSNSDDSASVVIGDIIIQGNADSTIVDKLDKVRKQIVDDVFKTMNKHTNMGGYRSVKHAY